jgi:hypothetical protein
VFSKFKFLRSCFESLAVASHPLQPDSFFAVEIIGLLTLDDYAIGR